MAFLAKKKKYKFDVRIEIEGLSSVPFVNAVLFHKIRLLDGGSFAEHSARYDMMGPLMSWQHMAFRMCVTVCCIARLPGCHISLFCCKHKYLSGMKGV